MADKQKILAGRNQVDAYRIAHSKLYDKGWHKGTPEAHTPLLKAMVNALKGLGFTSAETAFEPEKTEVLAKFWADSDLLNLQELGFADREDFDTNVRKDSISHTEINPETGEEVEVIELTPEGKALLNSLEEMWH